MAVTIGCAYKEYAQCKECNYVKFKECKNFRVWRAKYLLSDILPMTLNKVEDWSKNICYFSRKESKAKIVAASIALRNQFKVKKFTLNQAITVVVDRIEVEEKVIYLECRKSYGDQQKVQQVIESFVDNMLMQGKTVIIYANAGTIALNETWRKLKVDD